ncbi:hypothetical protein [Phocaeicola sartorii]|uniref:hypothetical protein n=1 Tax=Phocaeicola sartorii TaxID=671267 RepID=UPI003F68EBBA
MSITNLFSIDIEAPNIELTVIRWNIFMNFKESDKVDVIVLNLPVWLVAQEIV